MATFNNYEVTRRYNRPAQSGRTLLDMYFANNGQYFDPSSVSAVWILPDTGTTNGSPDFYLDRNASALGTSAYGMLAPSALSGSIVAYFDVSNGAIPASLSAAPVANYDPNTSAASGIYRVSSGHYSILPQGTAMMPAFSATGKYFDIWLIKDFNGSNWRLYFNQFETFNDRIVTYTEPFQVTSKAKLQGPKYMSLSSIQNLYISTEHFFVNKNMPLGTESIWQNTILQNAQLRIRQRHPQTTGDITTVVDWTEDIIVSSEDTIIYTWDTAALSKGSYFVQVKYNLLEQTIFSEEFTVVLR